MNILISLHLLLMMLLLGETSEARDPAGLDQLTRCIKIAEPLVKDSDNIFPLTIRDIERVCKLWDELTYCVKDYTLTYLTHTQQLEFNLAIESSIKSANQLCADDPEYRTSYVINAPCLKRVSINTSLCGGQYNYLADLVQGFQATDAQMCCAHHKFRECVLDQTPRVCDEPGGHPGSASIFMKSMLDRALGFLLQKCKNFVPNARDCPRGNFGKAPHPTNPQQLQQTKINFKKGFPCGCPEFSNFASEVSGFGFRNVIHDAGAQATASQVAAILQQTAEYIYQLEQEKTRLLSQNCQLKRHLNQQQHHADVEALVFTFFGSNIFGHYP
nr:uncharacterized protein LOC128704173 [Cherax quadricarinatus]